MLLFNWLCCDSRTDDRSDKGRERRRRWLADTTAYFRMSNGLLRHSHSNSNFGNQPPLHVKSRGCSSLSPLWARYIYPRTLRQPLSLRRSRISSVLRPPQLADIKTKGHHGRNYRPGCNPDPHLQSNARQHQLLASPLGHPADFGGRERQERYPSCTERGCRTSQSLGPERIEQ
jgi:hypothetical protein